MIRQPEVNTADAIWGAKAIAQFMGLSVDVVYDLADDPDTPIYKPSGRYCALKGELLNWMKTKPKVTG